MDRKRTPKRIKKEPAPKQSSLLETVAEKPKKIKKENVEKIVPKFFPSISKYTLQPTDNPHLFRVVNRQGDWVVYYHDQLKKYFWAVNYLIRHGFPKGDGFMNYLLSTTKEEAKKTLESAGDRGSRVHEAIRDLIDGIEIEIDRPYMNELTHRYEPLTDDEWECLRAFVNFCEDYKPEVVYREMSVCNHNYAGTIDFFGTIDVKGKRVKVLLDWKTSAAIYSDYKLQTAAYAYAASEMPEYTGVVRLGSRHKRKYELQLWDYNETKNHYRVFRSCVNSFELEHKPYEHDDEMIPIKLSVKINKTKGK